MLLKYYASIICALSLTIGSALPADATNVRKDVAAINYTDLAKCVWDNMSEADRSALATDPSHASNLSFGEIPQNHPNASAAIDLCRQGVATPVLWKGHFLMNLGMAQWATDQLKPSGITTQQLEQAWTSVPADQHICFGIMTIWALASVDKDADHYPASMTQGCTKDRVTDARQEFLQSLKIDGQTPAGRLAGMYMFGKGGEAVIITLMMQSDAQTAPAAVQ